MCNDTKKFDMFIAIIVTEPYHGSIFCSTPYGKQVLQSLCAYFIGLDFLLFSFFIKGIFFFFLIEEEKGLQWMIFFILDPIGRENERS